MVMIPQRRSLSFFPCCPLPGMIFWFILKNFNLFLKSHLSDLFSLTAHGQLLTPPASPPYRSINMPSLILSGSLINNLPQPMVTLFPALSPTRRWPESRALIHYTSRVMPVLEEWVCSISLNQWVDDGCLLIRWVAIVVKFHFGSTSTKMPSGLTSIKQF